MEPSGLFVLGMDCECIPAPYVELQNLLLYNFRGDPTRAQDKKLIIHVYMYVFFSVR